MYKPATINAELLVQIAVTLGDATSRTGFCNFMANIKQFWVYLGMLGGQSHMMMIHTPGIYCSIRSLMSAYHGKIMVFIGNRRATKEPILVCLPTLKSWEWHTGNATSSFCKLPPKTIYVHYHTTVMLLMNFQLLHIVESPMQWLHFESFWTGMLCGTQLPAGIYGFSGGKKISTFIFGRNIARVKILP